MDKEDKSQDLNQDKLNSGNSNPSPDEANLNDTNDTQQVPDAEQAVADDKSDEKAKQQGPSDNSGKDSKVEEETEEAKAAARTAAVHSLVESVDPPAVQLEQRPDGTYKMIIGPGASKEEMADVLEKEGIDASKVSSLVVSGGSDSERKTVSITPEMLKVVGNGVKELEIATNTDVEYKNTDGGDIWRNLYKVERVALNNGKGLPCNTVEQGDKLITVGAFENHPTLRQVFASCDDSIEFSKNFAKGTQNLTTLMIYFTDGLDHGTEYMEGAFSGLQKEYIKNVDKKEFDKLHGKEPSIDARMSENDVAFAKNCYNVQIEIQKEIARKTADDVKKVLETFKDFGDRHKTSLENFINLIDNAEEINIKSRMNSFVHNFKDDVQWNSEKGRAIKRALSDSLGRYQNYIRKIKALESLRDNLKVDGKAHMEIGARVCMGDNVLSFRNVDMQSSTDPGKENFDSEIKKATRDFVSAVETYSTVIKSSLVRNSKEKKFSEQEKIADFVDKSVEEWKKTLKERDDKKLVRGIKKEQIENVKKNLYELVYNKDVSNDINTLNDKLSSLWNSGDVGKQMFTQWFGKGVEIDPETGNCVRVMGIDEMKKAKNLLVLSDGSLVGDNCFCNNNIDGVAVSEHGSDEYKHFYNHVKDKVLLNKENIDSKLKEYNLLSKDATETDKEPGSYLEAIDQVIRNSEASVGKKDDKDKVKITPEDLENLREFREEYVKYSNDRTILNKNRTYEDFIHNRSFALQKINERIEAFEESFRNQKNQNLKTGKTEYSMKPEQLSSEQRQEYNKLIEQRDAILANMGGIKVGNHFMSNQNPENDVFAIVGNKKIETGKECFSNINTSKGILESHDGRFGSDITDDVVRKDRYINSNINYGRLLMGLDNIGQFFKNAPRIEYVRTGQAVFETILELLKLFGKGVGDLVRLGFFVADKYTFAKNLEKKADYMKFKDFMLTVKDNELFTQMMNREGEDRIKLISLIGEDKMREYKEKWDTARGNEARKEIKQEVERMASVAVDKIKNRYQDIELALQNQESKWNDKIFRKNLKKTLYQQFGEFAKNYGFSQGRGNVAKVRGAVMKGGR